MRNGALAETAGTASDVSTATKIRNRGFWLGLSQLPSPGVNPRVDARINPHFNPWADDRTCPRADHAPMNISDYLINAVFVFVVLRQARERQLDLRSLVVPLLVVAFVAHIYIHSIPTAGNDLALVAVLAGIGVTLGLLGGFATHIRIGDDGLPMVRVGWIAGALLIAGICSRMVFVFAVHNGAQPAIANFSIAHHIGAAAWPVALVSMALLEVTVRLITVQIRARRMTMAQVPSLGPMGAHA